MGTSGKVIRHDPDSYIPALLISFSKINEFKKYFEYQNEKGELSKIFNSLLYSIKLLDGHTLEFNKLKDKDQYFINKKDTPNIQELLLFILDKLHNELNENNNNNVNQKQNYTDEVQSYKVFLNNYYNKNKSPIQALFFGEKETISRCSKCKKTHYYFEVLKLLYFDIQPYSHTVELTELINNYLKQEQKVSLCQICNENAEILSRTDIKKLPEIFIICFDNIKDSITFNYYLNLHIKEEPYLLICFVINADDSNKKDKKYNVFYKEGDKWFIYNVSKKEVKEMNDVKLINKNPLVTFYQKKITHDKILMTKLYYNLSTLLNSLTEFPKLLSNHITDENKFDNYYVINKNWFNKLAKIFEPEEIFENDSIIFESFNQVTKIPNLNLNELKERVKLVYSRLKILKNEKIFMPEFETNGQSGLKYPKDFVLINENELNQLLIDLKIDISDIKKNLYQILFGENYLFIKSNIKDKENTYYICFSVVFIFNVEKILRFNDKKYFSREIGSYVKNKGGLDYYFELRNLDVKNTDIQKIIDRENENIGDFINIKPNDTLAFANKYILNNINNNGDNSINQNNMQNYQDFNNMMSFTIANNNMMKNNMIINNNLS